jgi:NADPH2:quinone reductase
MTKAVRISRTGGPEVLEFVDVEVGAPGPGQARIKQSALGLNYIDTYHRTGLYQMPLPLILGTEGAGVVTAVGDGVTHLKPGDRVAYADVAPGAYAEERLIMAHRLLKLPDSIDDRTAAAMMLKGLTAQYLLRRTYRVQKGDTILIHAAAGGVGLIVCQWARHLGATVIGTVGSDAKAELARAHGCDHAIVYTREDFKARVKEITGGAGVPVVYDSIGKTTFMDSLDCLAPLGMMVSFGSASGPPDPVPVGLLAQKGSIFLTRPGLGTYAAKRADLETMGTDLFEVVGKGIVKLRIDQTYALKDAAQAHRDLEARKTTGSTLLLP